MTPKEIKAARKTLMRDLEARIELARRLLRTELAGVGLMLDGEAIGGVDMHLRISPELSGDWERTATGRIRLSWIDVRYRSHSRPLPKDPARADWKVIATQLLEATREMQSHKARCDEEKAALARWTPVVDECHEPATAIGADLCAQTDGVDLLVRLRSAEEVRAACRAVELVRKDRES